MKNKQNEEQGTSGKVEVTEIKRLLVLAAVGLKLGRKILEKLESIEVSIEIIAREIARQLEKAE